MGCVASASLLACTDLFYRRPAQPREERGSLGKMAFMERSRGVLGEESGDDFSYPSIWAEDWFFLWL